MCVCVCDGLLFYLHHWKVVIIFAWSLQNQCFCLVRSIILLLFGRHLNYRSTWVHCLAVHDCTSTPLSVIQCQRQLRFLACSWCLLHGQPKHESCACSSLIDAVSVSCVFLCAKPAPNQVCSLPFFRLCMAHWRLHACKLDISLPLGISRTCFRFWSTNIYHVRLVFLATSTRCVCTLNLLSSRLD